MKSLDQITALAHGKKTHRKHHIRHTRSTKVNYPWIHKRYSCQAKAFIAHLVDGSNLHKITIKGEKDKKKVFKEQIYPQLLDKFPSLYAFVRKYYHKKGRKLNRKHFRLLVYARLVNMYENGFGTRTKEHPLNSSNKMLRAAYRDFSNS